MIARAGKDPRVVVEATYGWYWAVDVLEAAGAEVHLAHPLGVKAYSYRRVKNDESHASDLADLLRMGRLPEARGRPGRDRRAEGDQPLPAPAGQGADLGQGAGARGAGQARHPGHPYRHLRGARAGVAGWLDFAYRTRARSPRCGSWPGGQRVPATCPIGETTASSHGLSRTTRHWTRTQSAGNGAAAP